MCHSLLVLSFDLALEGSVMVGDDEDCLILFFVLCDGCQF